MQFDIPSPDQMNDFGRRLGAALFPGAVVALVGPLGAGKTFLVRAIAEGLGVVNSRVVCSPTFTLVHEYPARLTIYHFDVYRLKSPVEFAELGSAEYFDAKGVCLVEWADKVGSLLPVDRLQIEIEVTGEQSRRLNVVATGPGHAAIMQQLAG